MSTTCNCETPEPEKSVNRRVSASPKPRNSGNCRERNAKRDLQVAILAFAKVESGWHPPPIQVICRRSRDREDQDG